MRTGLALYARDGRLLAVRSQNLGTRARLKRAVPTLLDGQPALERLVLEGGGDLAEVWMKEGERRGLVVRVIGAEAWRQLLLLPRERRTGAAAKAHADGLARAVGAWSGAPAPKRPLRHDAAEAVCAGLWGVLDAGWLPALPAGLRR